MLNFNRQNPGKALVPESGVVESHNQRIGQCPLLGKKNADADHQGDGGSNRSN